MSTRLLKIFVALLMILLPVSMSAAWNYSANGNVLSAYGDSLPTANY